MGPALFPAVDLRGGRCVRLIEGDFARETVYGDDPVEQARRFEAAGAPWLHVVDLDAALTGDPTNRAVVGAVATALDIPVQAGGGVRSIADAEVLFDAGVRRVVMGTAALESPAIVGQVAELGAVAVGIDVKGDEVALRGWTQGSGLTLADAIGLFDPAWVDAFVVTQILRDGTLEGPDTDLLRAALRETDVEVIASGGVGQLQHLEELAALSEGGSGIGGIILGKALYEGTVDLEEAVRAMAQT
ncbi:MAG: 1-(5-phosphoribosyl)-5-[(5-phosphoribosylamino)methylideneamino]imidazole-4-carboxamide isomerase [Actinobacteria bacterium]|jgi:phosphoribosylformimino-5-aminoimidazole carboxamide ribotide isomerase|nr:1-(5-phosphoribosyl)-5-[(5-phosphoribosylamino)methylideneamino]imidazole-4-carboxamide isomerase [Actinomycetota bacterium]MBT3686929.1 1-(5-phosphoribosyl)-5-[(5-phosphoribosylamino)methylideneamino]imidazole-4-carboxamide isomerase [Actinomycetota bacterium]MBT4038072.1 1-(5-phosphoribosyl)-5-[(5-phosphoribosylamino)methylideneamino]imidazole-4-carboxamide isomerase [Actinomycetota bacterium]MBT4278914.1 1-(5-phosphoribosyl)-5-[(5-phosphoribosylamino)methylideneamino]imidazole-4-carboxamid|tara:strand:+ start:21227 stop:21961 length:735 start_codon:yes stop_codon:yes gene_type:complete